MADYKARVDSITKVDNRIDIGGTLFRDADEFPMPVISMNASTGTKEEAVELIKEEIRKFAAGYTLEANLQQYLNQEITL